MSVFSSMPPANTELLCGDNLTFLLPTDSQFLATQYKVLTSQTDSNFVPCVKVLFNGQIQLFYQTSQLVPLSHLISQIDDTAFLKISHHILRAIQDVKRNGFLSCQNIDVDPDHLFVDVASMQAYLIYLPVSKKRYPDYPFFEKALYDSLGQLASSISNVTGSRISRFSHALQTQRLPVEELIPLVSGFWSVPEEKKELEVGPIHLVSVNLVHPIDMLIPKTPFLIGKNPVAVDGVLAVSSSISRIHCRIDRDGSQYTVTDLNSSNGTFVNNARLMPNQPCVIHSGDILRLSKIEFTVKL